MSQNVPSGVLSRDDLLRILDASQRLAAAYGLEQLLEQVVAAGKNVLLADQASLWLYDHGTHELELKRPLFLAPLRVPAGQGLVGECLSLRSAINVVDAYQDPRFSRITDRSTGYRTKSILSIPLLGKQGEPVGALQLLNKKGGPFDRTDEIIAATLGAQCAVALQRAQLTEALLLKERLDEEVSLAREIQMGTLPAIMPTVPGYEVYGKFLPTQQTGGDTFDLVMLKDKLFLLMGDATGHGFGPALSATQMQAMLRVAFRCGVDLATAYCQVNNQLNEDLPADRFLTAFMGFLDPRKHELEYYSGGQGPILFYKAATGECEWREPTSFPLGVMELESPGTAEKFSFEQGDVLALLSDGIYEFLNEQQADFGQQRVAQWLLDYHHLTAADMGKRLLQELAEFAGDANQADDVTAVILKRCRIGSGA